MRCTAIVVISAAMLLGPPSVAAALTEADAVARGMANDDFRASMSARKAEAEGAVAAAGRWDNPSVEFSQEGLNMPGGDIEERFWWLRQNVNIAGVKGLERDAAAESRTAEEARVTLQERQRAAEIRERFYQAIAAQEAVQVLKRHQDRLDQIADIVKKRVDQGESSRYDSLRVRQESALMRSEFSEARARLDAARQRLFGVIGGAPDPLRGTLVPPSVPSTPIESAVKRHPRLAALAAERESAASRAKAARRKVWPELTLGVGRRELDEPGVTAEGNMVSLGIEVPLFNRGSGEAQVAESIAHQRQADYALTAAKLAGDIRAARSMLQAQRKSALELQHSVEADDASLTAMAEAAYQAGELTVMELIDAYRTELGTYREYIKRALEARLTHIELQRMTGDFP